MSDIDLGKLLKEKLKISEDPASTRNRKPGEFFFSEAQQPEVVARRERLDRVQAIMILRAAIASSVSDAKRYVDENFPKDPPTERELGELIYAYYHRR